METSNAEPALFFLFIFVLIVWALTTTVITPRELRYIPLTIMAIAPAIQVIYIMDKVTSARTMDHKFFKQATMTFFGSCLISASNYKLSRR